MEGEADRLQVCAAKRWGRARGRRTAAHGGRTAGEANGFGRPAVHFVSTGTLFKVEKKTKK